MKIFLAICCVLAFILSLGTCNFLTDAFDETIYAAIRVSLIADGESDVYTDCIVDVLRAGDAAKEFRSISNYFNKDDLMPKLRPKIEVANFLCRLTEFLSPIPLSVVVIVIAVLLCLIMIKICMCCFCSNNRNAVPNNNVKFIRV